jgi:hypothetical protein
MLLVGAGLLLQSFARLGRVQPGMQTERLLTARVTLPDIAYPRPEKIAGFYEQLIARLRVLPGVRAASTTFPLPMSGSITKTTFDLAEHPLPVNRQPTELTRLIGSDYFQAMGIPLVRGRFFADTDRLDAKPVVVINERFAQKYFPNQDAVGKQMKPLWAVGDQPPQMREIVGLSRQRQTPFLQEDFAPEMFCRSRRFVPTGRFCYGRRLQSGDDGGHIGAELASFVCRSPPSACSIYRASSLAGPRFNAFAFDFAASLCPNRGWNLRGDRVFGFAAHRRLALRRGALPSSIFRLVVGQAMTLIAISTASDF